MLCKEEPFNARFYGIALRFWDTETGQLLRSIGYPSTVGPGVLGTNGERLFLLTGGTADRYECEITDLLESFSCKLRDEPYTIEGLFSADSKWLATHSRVYYRRRPEYWWGVAWLPEFWLTVVFGAGLVWSIISDRRRLRQ